MKKKTVYVCSNCGYDTVKWMGQCPNCGEWNTLSEFSVSENKRNNFGDEKSIRKNKPMAIADIDVNAEIRIKSGIEEFDRVLGGGIVKGSLTLISGEPGIGKSTLLFFFF